MSKPTPGPKPLATTCITWAVPSTFCTTKNGTRTCTVTTTCTSTCFATKDQLKVLKAERDFARKYAKLYQRAAEKIDAIIKKISGGYGGKGARVQKSQRQPKRLK